MSLKNKTVFITGGSRGIGKSIALKLAANGANIVIAAKTIEENPKLGGTIYSTVAEVEQAGGRGLAVQCDIRFEEQVQAAVDKAVETFGGIDVLINNASAIALTGTEKTDPKKFDLMFDINVRGTFLVTRACLPFLKKAAGAQIITLSPPVNIAPKWLKGHVAYTMAKYNMSLMAMGWAAEFRNDDIRSNALWPVTTIDTAAVRNVLGGDTLAKMSRNPEIVAEAVHAILLDNSPENTGHCYTDEEVLAANGVTDLSMYSVVPGAKLYKDLFLD